MTQKERLELFEAVFHRIQLYREVIMDGAKVSQLLDIIGDWSYAHRAGNGELSDREVKRAITYQENRLRHFLYGVKQHDDSSPKDG
jgi:hypothetical protein